MIHPLRFLVLAAALGLAGQAVEAAAPAPVTTETLKGLHVNARFRPDDWKLLKDPKEFIGFLDQVYLTMAELTGHQPPMELRGHANLGAWGTAGLDGINIDWTCVPPFMKDFNSGKIEFGLVHEMGHVFDARDFARWYITPGCGGETFGNLKLSYALERLLLKESRYRIEFGPGGRQTGYDFNNNFYLNFGKPYLASATPWDKMGVDDLHSFHLNLIRKVGWDVYKKWFRAYYKIEAQKDGRAPPRVNDPLRINLVCALLAVFADENLVPEFQQWRMPVTDKSVLEVAKRYDLKEVCAATERQFAEEYAAGKIHLDPLGLRVRVIGSAAGGKAASIFSILRHAPGAVVRYTLDNTPVTATSRIDSGTPIPLAAAASTATVNAALFVSGKAQPVLTASATSVAE
ncbi:MAG: M60 family metallopeptidase [Verrucomicrobia bacterium]|nr:M60 family metallopeptidase [Verrucomicrobiota bacterium]